MNDIIIFNMTVLDLIVFITLVVLYVGGQHYYTRRTIIEYKTEILREVLGKMNSSYLDKNTKFYVSAKREPLDSYKSSEVKLKESKPLSAVEANKLKHESVTQAEIDTLLKPVFDKIVKASENGDSEIFLSGSGWYHCKNEQYKTATQQLTALGYSVWRDDNGFGVRVKW